MLPNKAIKLTKGQCFQVVTHGAFVDILCKFERLVRVSPLAAYRHRHTSLSHSIK